MNEFLSTVAAALVGTSLGSVLLAFLGSKWIGARIENSIRHEYDIRKVDYENAIRVRERSQLVAELMAVRLAYDVEKGMSPEHRERLNRLSFEACLWLPDGIAAKLAKALQEDPEAQPDWSDVLLDIRTYLSGPHSLVARDVTRWELDAEWPNRGLKPGLHYGQIEVLSIEVVSDDARRVIPLDELGRVETIKPDEILQVLVPPGTLGVAIGEVTSIRVDAIHTGEDGSTSHCVVRLHPSQIGHRVALMTERMRQQLQSRGDSTPAQLGTQSFPDLQTVKRALAADAMRAR